LTGKSRQIILEQRYSGVAITGPCGGIHLIESWESAQCAHLLTAGVMTLCHPILWTKRVIGKDGPFKWFPKVSLNNTVLSGEPFDIHSI